jgi:hypothetical protein
VTLVVHIDPFAGGQTAATVAYSPWQLANPHLIGVVDLADLASINPNELQRLGELLAERICQGNETIRVAFERALELAAQAESLPICFRVGDDVVHALSWEAFVGNQRFVALDRRWPIARIARGGNISEGAQLPFEAPLKLCAVLSAVGRSALEEWRGIAAAVQAAREDGLEIDVTLLAGEEDVLTEARETDGVDAQPVPEGAFQLRTTLRGLAPHLLHVFCHGTIKAGVRYLDIATARDFDDPAGSNSSVNLHVEELGTDLADTNTWAAVLNMCRGADAGDQQLTHAEGLVNSGVPVAVGMRRLIDAADAFAFSAALYPSVFTAIKAAAEPTANGIVRWPGTLTRARQALRDRHPASDDTWTLPVLYTRPGEFRLVLAPPGKTEEVTKELSEAETVDGALAAFGEAAPAGLQDALRDLAPSL